MSKQRLFSSKNCNVIHCKNLNLDGSNKNELEIGSIERGKTTAFWR